MIDKKRKKALSLFEVIVVIAISSLTIIGAINIVVNSSIAIKTNEVRDYSNGIMLKALELMKSSSDILVTAQGNTVLSILNSDLYFTLKEDTSGKYLDYDVPPAEDYTHCSKTNIYYVPVRINGVDSGNLLCLQIHIIPRNNIKFGNYYEIEMKISYTLPKGQEVETYKTFRYGSFKQKP